MTGPPPPIAITRVAVRRCLSDLPAGGLVLVACSGGTDSLGLAAAAAFVAPRLRLRCGAVVVDHGWRPESAAVASTAAVVCVGIGLDPVRVVEVAPEDEPGGGLGDAPGAGPEAAARAARYAALDAAAEQTGALAVLLGHTRDDQAETVLLGLARGAGARSLAGMPARRGRYRRPFLDLPRATVGAAVEAAGLRPWQDPANLDPAFARSRVRSAMRTLEDALGPGVDAALARTAGQLREDADALDALAADLLERARLAEEVRAVCLDVAPLAAAAPALRARALLVAAGEAGSPAGALSRRHALAMGALVTAWRGQGAVHLPGGNRCTRAPGPPPHLRIGTV
jgi:tRNA(Ile)-lysidine synthetase-like protein